MANFLYKETFFRHDVLFLKYIYISWHYRTYILIPYGHLNKISDLFANLIRKQTNKQHCLVLFSFDFTDIWRNNARKREGYLAKLNCLDASPCKSMYILLNCNLLFNAGVCKREEEDGPSTEEESQCSYGEGVCKWFNVRMGFGFLSMTNREGLPLEEPVDVFVHQVGFLNPNHLNSVGQTHHIQTSESNL